MSFQCMLMPLTLVTWQLLISVAQLQEAGISKSANTDVETRMEERYTRSHCKGVTLKTGLYITGPDSCLQWFTDDAGQFASFNYDLANSMSTPATSERSPLAPTKAIVTRYKPSFFSHPFVQSVLYHVLPPEWREMWDMLRHRCGRKWPRGNRISTVIKNNVVLRYIMKTSFPFRRRQHSKIWPVLAI